MKITRQMLASYAFQFSLLALFLVGLYQGELPAALSSLFGFGLALVPMLLQRRNVVALPWELTMWIFLALFLHNLGVVMKFYDTVWWWDKMTHLLSTSLIAGFGFIGIVIVDKYADSIHLPPIFLPFFIVVFVMAMGVTWEIIEYAFDLLGANMQYSLSDTVIDLIFDLVGGLLVAAIGPLYLRNRSVDALISQLGVDGTVERIRSRMFEK